MTRPTVGVRRRRRGRRLWSRATCDRRDLECSKSAPQAQRAPAPLLSTRLTLMTGHRDTKTRTAGIFGSLRLCEYSDRWNYASTGRTPASTRLTDDGLRQRRPPHADDGPQKHEDTEIIITALNTSRSRRSGLDHTDVSATRIRAVPCPSIQWSNRWSHASSTRQTALVASDLCPSRSRVR